MASGEEGALITVPLLTVVSEGPDVGRQYRLGDETTIGRQQHADIWLDDETVSRNHTRVQRQANQWTVEDLRSTAGTFLDGLRINEITPLLDQQTIRIGGVELLFCEHGVWDQQAEDERNTDPVTGVSRRGYFVQRVAAEIANAHAQNAPLCLLAIDITQLRTLNERDGFVAGDAALRALATHVRDVVGERGHVGRIGGDEIGACLPGHTQQRTRELAGAIESKRPDLRLSFGFAELDGSQNAESLVRAALDDTRGSPQR